MKEWWHEQAQSAYLIAVGLLLLAASWGAVLKQSGAAAASLAVLAGGALIVAPFASRIHGTLKVGPVEMTLRERVAAAARTAPVESLHGVLPLLESGDVAVEQVPLSPALVGHKLTDPDASFIRQELKVSVIAAQLPGETRWHAGGEISDLTLPEGTILLVAGPRNALQRLHER